MKDPWKVELQETEQIQTYKVRDDTEYDTDTHDWFAYNRIILKQEHRDEFDATTRYSFEEIVKMFNKMWNGWIQTADYHDHTWSITVMFLTDLDLDEERGNQFIGILTAYQVSCEIIAEMIPNDNAWSDATYDAWYKFSGQLVDIHQVFEWMNSRFAYL